MINDYEVWSNKPNNPFRPLPVEVEGDFVDYVQSEGPLEGESYSDVAVVESDIPDETVSPKDLMVVDQTVTLQTDGTYRVEAVLEFSGVEGASSYEVRVA